MRDDARRAKLRPVGHTIFVSYSMQGTATQRERQRERESACLCAYAWRELSRPHHNAFDVMLVRIGAICGRRLTLLSICACGRRRHLWYSRRDEPSAAARTFFAEPPPPPFQTTLQRILVGCCLCAPGRVGQLRTCNPQHSMGSPLRLTASCININRYAPTTNNFCRCKLDVGVVWRIVHQLDAWADARAKR